MVFIIVLLASYGICAAHATGSVVCLHDVRIPGYRLTNSRGDNKTIQNKTIGIPKVRKTIFLTGCLYHIIWVQLLVSCNQSRNGSMTIKVLIVSVGRENFGGFVW